MPSIQSEGDLEVVVLFESHELLSSIIGPDLYGFAGSPERGSAQPHDTPSFELFLIRVVELFADGPRSATINGQQQNWSLLRGLSWLTKRYPEEAIASGLGLSTRTLVEWLEQEAPVSFWCADVDTQVILPMSRQQLISITANGTKHHILRLSDVLGKLDRQCCKAGYSFSAQQLLPVFRSLLEEGRSRLRYHFSYLVEMLAHMFLALNEIVVARFEWNPTNDVRNIQQPPGVTSDVFRDLYGHVLVFKRYSKSRITDFTPDTWPYLRLRY
jgi:hypothetical protein